MGERVLTTVVGSYPQPDWLVDKPLLERNSVPRIRMPEMWRVPALLLDGAQDDAVRLAVADMERAGIDIVSDGEQRRESYFNQFANSLDGLDLERPGTAQGRFGRPTPVPRVVGPIHRARPVLRGEMEFLRSIRSGPIKVTLPGPFTMAQLAQDEHYGDAEQLAMAYAAAVNEELLDLESLVDVLQLDEPYLQAHPDRARGYGVAAGTARHGGPPHRGRARPPSGFTTRGCSRLRDEAPAAGNGFRQAQEPGRGRSSGGRLSPA